MSSQTKRRVPILASFFLLLAGCGFGSQQADSPIDPPEDVQYVEEEQSLEEDSQTESSPSSNDKVSTDDQENMVKRQLFLIDENGLVAPQVVNVPHTKEVAKQSLQYLVQGGPVMNVLPNGFKAVLPPETEVLGVNIKEDKTAVVDFSEAFGSYKSENEKKVLEAITWTLTQFDTVERVQLRVNGKNIDSMPVNGTPIEDGVSRADGINMQLRDAVDLSDSEGVTLYFTAQSGQNVYDVPVSKRIPEMGTDPIEQTVNSLIKGPAVASGLYTDFSSDLKLLQSSFDEQEGLVTLTFNEALLKNEVLTDESLHAIVLSLTEQKGINEVAFKVDGKDEILQESGDVLSRPVTRQMVQEPVEF